MTAAGRAGLAGTTGAASCASRNRPAAAGCKEYRQHPRSMLALTGTAGDRLIGILHWADSFKALLAIQANVFVDRHGTLAGLL